MQSALDAFYFCVVTLTTVLLQFQDQNADTVQVGYGDMSPTNDGCRVCVIIYGFIGVVLIASALGVPVLLPSETPQAL